MESSKDRLLGLFAAAGIPAEKVWELPNGYWPDHKDYDEVRKANPWLLVKTPHGLVEIGWRKRVISIDWSEAEVRAVVTQDDVTKGETYVHAYSYQKALEYLISWKTAVWALAAINP